MMFCKTTLITTDLITEGLLVSNTVFTDLCEMYINDFLHAVNSELSPEINMISLLHIILEYHATQSNCSSCMAYLT